MRTLLLLLSIIIRLVLVVLLLESTNPEDEDEDESDVASVRRTASHSRMALLASLTKSEGCRRLGRLKSVGMLLLLLLLLLLLPPPPVVVVEVRCRRCCRRILSVVGYNMAGGVVVIIVLLDDNDDDADENDDDDDDVRLFFGDEDAGRLRWEGDDKGLVVVQPTPAPPVTSISTSFVDARPTAIAGTTTLFESPNGHPPSNGTT